VNNRGIELSVGLFIIAALGAFLTLALKVSGLSYYPNQHSYRLSASFDNIGGLKVRAPVRVAGVQVGEVENITIDPKTFKAVVELRINSLQDQLPTDTAANIQTEGLLGSNFIALAPGYAPDMLKDGERIEVTHSALVLENLIGQFLYGANKK
jgi:phospholipid/cholesterol/gamma-HCH transport system substrate-binding protein